jgi:SAM-dependent methyltransferase
MEPDGHYDVIVNRHLVWTLVDPAAAFTEWLRVLKPGGRLVIIDGDFVNPGFVARTAALIAAFAARLRISRQNPHRPKDLMETHRSILARVHFSQGARAEAVAELLRRAGFIDIVIDTDMRAIHRTQAKNFGFLRSLERATQHRYAVVGQKKL